MKQTLRLIATIGLIAALLCLVSVPAFAQGAPQSGQFPEGVIEVPQGTEIAINDDLGTVTIVDNPADIEEGDTFIVYLQDLPIGYIAKDITVEGGNTVISVEKADKSVYAQLEEEGVIELTSDMYEFIPASASDASSANAVFGTPRGFTNAEGKLTFYFLDAFNSESKVEFSNLSLSHSFSEGNISVALNGNWSLVMSTAGDSPGEVLLGELRVYGVGKIALYVNVSISMEMSVSGSFSVGFNVGNENKIIKDFSVSPSYEIKGEVTVSLKVTAGIDIVAAEADLFAEVGIRTHFKTKNTVTVQSCHPSTNARAVPLRSERQASKEEMP